MSGFASTPIARHAWTVVWLVLLMGVVGCVEVTPFVRTDEDEQAEALYKETYAEHMLGIHETFDELFAPSGSNPGVCNVGGNRQACYDADVIAIDRWEAMLQALDAIPVPPRYVEGDRLLREAIRGNVRGLELRNKAFTDQDQAAWDEHEQAIAESTSLFLEAWEAFPADNRPQPPP